MLDKEKDQSPEVSSGQKFFDNLFLLMAFSLLLSIGLYNVWGIIELFTRPVLP